jgi:hypothetical protein
MNTLSYIEARPKIKSGDIVHIFRPQKKASAIQTVIYTTIEFFTGSPIYHNVVAMWMTSPNGEEKLMCVESNIKGGKQIVPLSTYCGRKMQVQPLPVEFKFADMEEAALRRVGQQGYSIMDFVAIGLQEFVGLKIKDFRNQVCSELCAMLWKAAGVPLLESQISPGKLKGDLQKLGIEVSIEIEE